MSYKLLLDKFLSKFGEKPVEKNFLDPSSNRSIDDEHVIVTGQANIDDFIKNYASSMQGRVYKKDKKILKNITLDYTGNNIGKEIKLGTDGGSGVSISVND